MGRRTKPEKVVPRVPHATIIEGVLVRVRWGAARDRHWQELRYRKDRGGIIGYAEYKRRLITLHPDLRRDPRAALETFLHERYHFIAHFRLKRRATYKDGDHGNKRRRFDLSHRQMYMLESVEAQYLIDNRIQIPCACGPCQKKVAA